MNSKLLICGMKYELWHHSCSYSEEPITKSSQDIWNFGMKKKSEKRVSRKDAKAPRFREISKCLTLRSWRPFDVAQDMLGAINFLANGVPGIMCGIGVNILRR
jgi:hypothetical protein